MMRPISSLLTSCILAYLSANAAGKANVHWDTDDHNTLNFFYETTTVGDTVGIGEIIDTQNKKGTYDAGLVCAVTDISSVVKEDLHITRIEPKVTEFEEYGPIVHHMDLFACQESVVEEYNALNGRVEQSNWCGYDRFLETSCRQIIWAYDKGADAFDFPQDTGILIGPSAGFNFLVMQIHYLLPENYQPDGKGFDDASGFRLLTEPARERYDLGMFGFIGIDLDIPPGQKSFEWRAHLSSEELHDAISADFEEHGKVYPVAVHLHGHEHMIGARLEHYRGNELIGTYGEIDPYHGYGHDQTFMSLHSGKTGSIQLDPNTSGQSIEPLLEGDSLTYVCTYKSTTETEHMYHGVSHGDEMCAPLIMYYPKARGRDGRNSDNIALVRQEKNMDLMDVEDEA